ncbi:hypothetical protein LSTR_LSTR015378 [Laodelphax striatellus]|uniref:Cadherin domain-containing protein n=1 Tax=Laodelphax striatellus TaxID=195883 RepID=A0A482X349_LAOST|nr:hypothetical protein LSTR_LSTR015378 [Laodelphax striatellus]
MMNLCGTSCVCVYMHHNRFLFVVLGVNFVFFSYCTAYLLVLTDNDSPGKVIFNASTSQPSKIPRVYSLNTHKSAPAVKQLFEVDSASGVVTLRKKLQCDGVRYPNLFTIYVDSLSNATLDYISFPLRILIHGCEDLNFDGESNQIRLSEARKWPSDTIATFSVPVPDYESGALPVPPTDICLRRSQPIVNLPRSLVAATISAACSLAYLHTSDARFAVETRAGDLVAAQDVCVVAEPPSSVTVALEYQCAPGAVVVSPLVHYIKIYFSYRKEDADSLRVRRDTQKRGAPTFERVLYLASVSEEQAAGVSVCTLTAKEGGGGGGGLQYSMVSLLDSRSQTMFGIDSKTGGVTTITSLDRELLDVHYFRVTAMDSSFPPKSATTTLQVNVLDANDHAPIFEAMGGEYQDFVFFFSVEGCHDVLSNSVSARTRKSSTATVVVRVSDDNDNYPQFVERTYTVNIPEDTNWKDNPVIATVKATDADEGQNAAIRYAIIGGNVQGQFSIDSQNGEVTLVKPLDYESMRSYRITIRAQDGGSPSRSNTTQLLVNVRDVNDNAPRFYTSLFQESVVESVPLGYSIVRVQAYDADEGENAVIKYSLRPNSGSTTDLPITVDSDTGWLHTNRALDREQNAKFQFQVLAIDGGTPARTATASVIVTVQDVNDNDPVFSPKQYEAVVREDDTPGTPVANVVATDPDENPRLHYEITGGNTRGRFAITTQNGRGLVTITQPLDYKQEKRFILLVRATDSGGRYDTATVYVNVTDANNFPPVFDNAPYAATVFEDAPKGTTVLIVAASDGDVGENAHVRGNTRGRFAITTQNGRGLVTITQPLDYKQEKRFILLVRATDSGGRYDTATVYVNVTDANNFPPVFDNAPYAATVFEDAPKGTTVLIVAASDGDVGENAHVSSHTVDRLGIDSLGIDRLGIDSSNRSQNNWQCSCQ